MSIPLRRDLPDQIRQWCNDQLHACGPNNDVPQDLIHCVIWYRNVANKLDAYKDLLPSFDQVIANHGSPEETYKPWDPSIKQIKIDVPYFYSPGFPLYPEIGTRTGYNWAAHSYGNSRLILCL
jgi:hypothetical protein